jgi:hypothetical protein
MKRFAVRCSALALLGLAVVVFSSPSTAANLADEPTIKEVMKKVNSKDGLCKAIGTGVNAKEPKWDEISEKAKALVPLAKALGKNKPPKGTEESWTKLSGGYAKAAEDLEKAAADKDAKAAKAAFKTISDCKGCHSLHK